MDSKRNSLYKNLSILIFTLSSPCLLLDEVFTTWGIGISIPRLLFFVNIIILGTLSLKGSRFDRLQKVIISFLLASLIYWFVLGTTVYVGTGYTTRAIIRNILIALVIIPIMANKKFVLHRLLHAFMILAIILSFISILQYAGKLLGIIHLNTYYYKTYSPGYMVYYNFGGFADPFSFVGEYYRNQSFFKEPARFAQYLMIPFFILSSRVLRIQPRTYLFYTISIGLAFVLTFSVANMFGLFIGLAFYSLRRKSTSNASSIGSYVGKYIKRSLLFVISMGLFIVLFNDAANTNILTYSGSFLGKNLPKRISERADRMERAMEPVMMGKIFGDISTRDDWSRNPTAIGMLLIKGGLPIALLTIIFLISYYRKIVPYIKKGEYSLIYVGGIAYFIGFNWYGDYYEYIYWFILILLAELRKRDRLISKI